MGWHVGCVCVSLGVCVCATGSHQQHICPSCTKCSAVSHRVNYSSPTFSCVYWGFNGLGLPDWVKSGRPFFLGATQHRPPKKIILLWWKRKTHCVRGWMDGWSREAWVCLFIIYISCDINQTVLEQCISSFPSLFRWVVQWQPKWVLSNFGHWKI